jgi:hypothetical protein
MPDAVASRRKNRTLIGLAVLGTLALLSVVRTIENDRDAERRARRDEAALAHADRPTPTITASTAAVTAPAIVSATASASASTTSHTLTSTSSVAVVPKRRRYGGKDGSGAGGNFSECLKCDAVGYHNDMGLRVAETSVCFAASEYEPPLHENPYYTLSVDDAGNITMLNAAGGAPNLDRCLLGVIQKVGIKGGPGTFKVGFQGECTKGWNNHCD